uniref:Predicted protein n=1 Tax=Hordeum vulgare subsp. vulgare TaxID=112509 RepID=F2CXY8_HORVV|nr:predicted protein [Hordeum vulgare subsp. vulgare]
MVAAGVTSSCFSHGLTRRPASRYFSTNCASHGWSECMGHARIGFPWLMLSTVEFQPQWLMKAAVAGCARISSCGAHPVITSPVPRVCSANSDASLACRRPSASSVDTLPRSASRNTQMNRCLLPFSAAASSATCPPRSEDVEPNDT